MSSATPPPFQQPPRYVMLRQYLQWLTMAATAVLVFSGFGVAVMLLLSLSRHSTFGFLEAVVVGLVVLASAGITFLWSMVAIGAVEVLIDIEANSRKD